MNHNSINNSGGPVACDFAPLVRVDRRVEPSSDLAISQVRGLDNQNSTSAATQAVKNIKAMGKEGRDLDKVKKMWDLSQFDLILAPRAAGKSVLAKTFPDDLVDLESMQGSKGKSIVDWDKFRSLSSDNERISFWSTTLAIAIAAERHARHASGAGHARLIMANVPIESVLRMKTVVWLPNKADYVERMQSRNRQVADGTDTVHSAKSVSEMQAAYDKMSSDAVRFGLTVVDEIIQPPLVGIESNPGPSAVVNRANMFGAGLNVAYHLNLRDEYARFFAAAYNEAVVVENRVIPVCYKSYTMFKDFFPDHEFGSNDGNLGVHDVLAWDEFMMNAYGKSVRVVANPKSTVAKTLFKLIVPAPRLVGIEPNPGPPSTEDRLFTSFMPQYEKGTPGKDSDSKLVTNSDVDGRAQAVLDQHRENLERVKAGLEPLLIGFSLENLRAAASGSTGQTKQAVETLVSVAVAAERHGKNKAVAPATAPNSPKRNLSPPIELRNSFAILASLLDGVATVELDIVDCVTGVANLKVADDRSVEEDLALLEIVYALDGKKMGASWKTESIVGEYVSRATAALSEKREREKKAPPKKVRDGEDKGGKVMKEQSKRVDEPVTSSTADFIKWRLQRRIAYNKMRAQHRAARQHEYLESVWLSQAIACNAIARDDALELFGEATVAMADRRAEVLLWLGAAASRGEEEQLDQHQFPSVNAYVRTNQAIKAVRRLVSSSSSTSLSDALQARLLREGIEANPGPNPYRVDPIGGAPLSANPLNNPGLRHSPVSRWIQQLPVANAPPMQIVDMGAGPPNGGESMAVGGPDVSQYLRNMQAAAARAVDEAAAINPEGMHAHPNARGPAGGIGGLIGAVGAAREVLPLAAHYADQVRHLVGRQPSQSFSGGLNTAAAFAAALSQLGLAAGAENPIMMLQAVAALVDAVHGDKGSGKAAPVHGDLPDGAVPLVRASPAVSNQSSIMLPNNPERYYESRGHSAVAAPPERYTPAPRLVGIETNPGPALVIADVPAAMLVGIEPNPGPPMDDDHKSASASSVADSQSSSAMLKRTTMALDPLNAGTVDDQMAASVAVSSSGVISSVQTFELTKSADAIAENLQPTSHVFAAANTNMWFGRSMTMSFSNDRLGAPASVSTKAGALLVGDYTKSLAGVTSTRGSYSPNISFAQSRVSFRNTLTFFNDQETVRNNKFVFDPSCTLQGRANCSSGLSALGEVLQLGIGKMIQGSPDQVINANVQNILKLNVGGLPVGAPVGLNATVFYYFMAELDRARPDDKTLDLYVLGRSILMAINRRGMSSGSPGPQVDFFPNPTANGIPIVTPGNLFKTNAQGCPKAFERLILGQKTQYQFYVGTLTDYLNAWRSYNAGRTVAGNYQDIFNGLNSGETRLITCMAANMSNALETGCALVSAWAATNVLPLDNNGNLSYLGLFNFSNPPKTFVMLFNTAVPDTIQIGNFLLPVGPKFGATNRLGETAAVYTVPPPPNTIVVPAPTSANCLDLSGFGVSVAPGVNISTESIGGDVSLRAFNNLAAFSSNAMVDRMFSWLGRGAGCPTACNMYTGEIPNPLPLPMQDLKTPNTQFATGGQALPTLTAPVDTLFDVAQRTSYPVVTANSSTLIGITITPNDSGNTIAYGGGTAQDYLFDFGCDYCPMNTGLLTGMAWNSAAGNEVGEFVFNQATVAQPDGTCYTPCGMANDIIDVATKMGICSQTSEDSPFIGCCSLAAFENTVYALSAWKTTVAEIAMKSQQIDKSLLSGMMSLVPFNATASPEPETLSALNMKGRIWQTIFRQTGGLIYRPNYFSSVAAFYGEPIPTCSFSNRPLAYSHCSVKAPIAVRLGFSGNPCDHTCTKQHGVNLTFAPTVAVALKDAEQSVHTADPTGGSLFAPKYFSRAYDDLFDDRSYAITTTGLIQPKSFLGKVGFGVINAAFNAFPWPVACWSTTTAAYMLQANQIEDITGEVLWCSLAANPRVRFAPRVIMDMYRKYDKTTPSSNFYIEVPRGYNPVGIVGNVEDDITEYEPAKYVPTTAARPNFLDSSTYTVQGAANGVDGVGTTSVGAFLSKRATGAGSSSNE